MDESPGGTVVCGSWCVAVSLQGRPGGHDKYDAIAVAEKTVKNNLVSPSSAKFCKMSEYSVTLHGETWTVTGHVDANNSLGASIRNTFLVMFTFTSSDRYNIDLCSID